MRIFLIASAVVTTKMWTIDFNNKNAAIDSERWGNAPLLAAKLLTAVTDSFP